MKRFTTHKNGYRYDKVILYTSFTLMILLMLYIFNLYEWDFSKKIIVRCDADQCENPFYSIRRGEYCDASGCTPVYNPTAPDCSYDWCDSPTLSRGVYGYQIPPIVKLFPWVSVGLVLLALVLNHFIHNKGRRPSIEPPIPKWLIKLAEKEEDDKN